MKFEAAPLNAKDDIPTLQKWAKTVDDRSTEISHRVETIWLPNLYSNFTLVTSSYRFRADKGHPYYEIIAQHIEEWCEAESVLFLQVAFEPKLSVSLLVLEDERCEWDDLGETGYKLSNVQRRKNPPSSKTAKAKKLKADQPAQDAQEGASIS